MSLIGAKTGIKKPQGVDLRPAHQRLVSRYGPSWGQSGSQDYTQEVQTASDISADFTGLGVLIGSTGPIASNGLWPDNGFDTIFFAETDVRTNVFDRHHFVYRLHDDKTVTQLGDFNSVLSNNSSASGWGQTGEREFVVGHRIDAGIFPCYVDAHVINDTGYGNQATQHSSGGERYHNAVSWFPGIASIYNGTNPPYGGTWVVNYAGGTGALVNSQKLEAAMTYTTSNPQNAPVGGVGDGKRQRYDPSQTYPKFTYCGGHFSDGTSVGTADADSVTLDILHTSWDGTTDNGTLTVTEAVGAYVHYTPTGEGTANFPTTWGNMFVFYDSDTNPSTNAGGILPITWVGSTPTVGTFFPWKYTGTWGINGIAWWACGARAQNLNPNTLGEYDSDNEYRTFYVYTDGVDVIVDTIKIKIYEDGDHAITPIHKEVVRVLNTTVVNMGHVIICNNGKDFMMLKTDDNIFRYVRHAWGD